MEEAPGPMDSEPVPDPGSEPVSDPALEPVSDPVTDPALEPASGGSIVTDIPPRKAVTEAKPKRKPRKPIEKLPCPKCGKKYSKQVLQYRTHKCESPVFEPEEAPPPPASLLRSRLCGRLGHP